MSIFQQYPFSLPPLAVSNVFLMDLTVGVLFLQEALESKKSKKDHGPTLGCLLISICYGRQLNNKNQELIQEFGLLWGVTARCSTSEMCCQAKLAMELSQCVTPILKWDLV